MRTVLLLLLVALAAVAAGCGEDADERNDYISEVNRVQAEFQSSFDQQLSKITSTSTLESDQRVLDRFRRAVDAAVRGFDGIDPPAEVATLHDELIKAVGAYGAIVTDAKKTFASEDAQVVREANVSFGTKITSASQQITRTIAKINRRLQE